MKLFAEIYLDEDISVLIATLLRARGFNVTTVREEGMLQGSDSEQLARAVELGRCIFTHNRVDYEILHRSYQSSHLTHFGILIASRRSPYELVRRIAALLDTLSADEINNQLLYL